MKNFLEYLIGLIVDHKSDLKVDEQKVGENAYQYVIFANKEDIGKIIGKQGKIIQAIRNVAKILAVKENKQIRIELAELKN